MRETGWINVRTHNMKTLVPKPIFTFMRGILH